MAIAPLHEDEWASPWPRPDRDDWFGHPAGSGSGSRARLRLVTDEDVARRPEQVGPGHILAAPGAPGDPEEPDVPPTPEPAALLRVLGPADCVQGGAERLRLGVDVAQRRRARASRRVVRRRVVAASLVVGLLVLLALPLSSIAGRPTATTPGTRPMAGACTAGSVYVVPPGATLQSVAEQFAGGAGTGNELEALESELGSDAVVPGEHICVP